MVFAGKDTYYMNAKENKYTSMTTVKKSKKKKKKIAV